MSFTSNFKYIPCSSSNFHSKPLWKQTGHEWENFNCVINAKIIPSTCKSCYSFRKMQKLKCGSKFKVIITVSTWWHQWLFIVWHKKDDSKREKSGYTLCTYKSSNVLFSPSEGMQLSGSILTLFSTSTRYF